MKRYIAFFILSIIAITQICVIATVAEGRILKPTRRNGISPTVISTTIDGLIVGSGDTIDLTQLPAEGDAVTIRLPGGYSATNRTNYTIICNSEETIKNIAITVDKYTDLTIENLNIMSEYNHGKGKDWEAFSTIHFAGVDNTLVINGINTISSGNYEAAPATGFGAAIGIPGGAELQIIKGTQDAFLNAFSVGSRNFASAIGAGAANSTSVTGATGKLTIKGAKVYAKGGYYVAIGSNYSTLDFPGELNIEENASVKAEAQRFGIAYDKVNISDSTVEAKAPPNAVSTSSMKGGSDARINITNANISLSGGYTVMDFYSRGIFNIIDSTVSVTGNNYGIEIGNDSTLNVTSSKLTVDCNNIGMLIPYSVFNVMGKDSEITATTYGSVANAMLLQSSTMNIMGEDNKISATSLYGGSSSNQGIELDTNGATINLTGKNNEITAISNGTGKYSAGIYLTNSAKLNVTSGKVYAYAPSGGIGGNSSGNKTVNISGGEVVASGTDHTAFDIGNKDATYYMSTIITGGSVKAVKFAAAPTNGIDYGNSELIAAPPLSGKPHETVTRTVVSRPGYENYDYTYTVPSDGIAYVWLPKLSIDTKNSLPDAILSFKNPPRAKIDASGYFLGDISFLSVENLPQGFTLDKDTGVISIDNYTPPGQYKFVISAVDKFNRIADEKEFIINVVVRDYDVTFVSNEGEHIKVKGNLYGPSYIPDIPLKYQSEYSGYFTSDGRKITETTPIEEDTIAYIRAGMTIQENQPAFNGILKLRNVETGKIAYIGIKKEAPPNEIYN